MNIGNAEKCFPRGGKKPAISISKKSTFTLFGKKNPKNKPAKKDISKPKRKNQRTDGGIAKQNLIDKHIERIEALTYKTLAEGMIILGCVKDVKEFDLLIDLPGRLRGKVPVTNISEPYTSALQSIMEGKPLKQECYKLQQMFKSGQHITCKISQIKSSTDNKFSVILSLFPQEVHSSLSHTNVTKHLVLTSAVCSIEEHGYIMDIGIQGTRSFLKKSNAEIFEKNWNNDKPLGIGQLVRCMVIKSTTSGMYTNVELTADPKIVAQAISEKCQIREALPGALFTVTVTKVLKTGLQVNYSGNLKGFVNEDYLTTPLSKLEHFEEGSQYPARVLYVTLNKVAYFTMDTSVCAAEVPTSPFTFIKIGDIILKAKIKRLSSRGIFLQIGKKKMGIKGFVSIHRTKEGLLNDLKKSLMTELEKQYPLNSVHKCKVLSYDYMERVFICSFEKAKLDEKTVSIDKFSLGMKVKCSIVRHTKKGLLVTIVEGNKSLLEANVPTLHLSDVPLKHPEKKFVPGTQCNARVLSIKEGKIRLTLKPTLVSSKLEPLINIEGAKQGHAFEGVVVNLSEKGVLVAFYGDLRGWVPTDKIGVENVDPTTAFYLGQVVKCFVVNVNKSNNNIIMTMIQPNSVKNIKNDSLVKFAHVYDLEVIQVQSEDLIVSLKEHNEEIEGSIPMHQLTNHPKLAKHILETYKPGDRILGAYCLKEGSNPQFTIQTSLIKFFEMWREQQSEKEENGFNALDVNHVIPCIVTKVEDKGVEVNLIIPGCDETIFIPIKELSNSPGVTMTDLSIVKHQVLAVRILKVFPATKKVHLTANVLHCWNGDLEMGIILLSSFLQDQKRILDSKKANGDPFGYFCPGDHFEGTVCSVSELGTVLKHKSGIHAVVEPYHCKGVNIKIGSTVQGKILLVDIVNHCVEVTLRPELMRGIRHKKVTGLFEGCCVRGETLLAKPDQVVICLKGAAGQNKLASVPTRMRLNDFQPYTTLFKLGEINKFVIKMNEDGMIIAILKKVFLKPYLMKFYSNLAERISGNGVIDSENYISNKIVESNANSEMKNCVSGTSEMTRKRKLSDNSSDTNMCTNDPESNKKQKKQHVTKEEIDNDNSTHNCDQSSERTLLNEENNHPEELQNKQLKKNQKANLLTCDVSLPCLNTNTHFVWDSDPRLLPVVAARENVEDISSDEENNIENSKKRRRLTRAERYELAQKEEENIRKAEERLLDVHHTPQSVDDFDRLVLASPNSSMCWIKYMAFHLQATEFEKARAVAQRALKTISFREEQEKLNVWVALLNLENLYGSKESLKKTLEEAVQSNDAWKVYMQMIQIYSDSGKLQDVEKLVSLVTKRYSDNKETWLNIGAVYMKGNQLEKARTLLQKALTRLEKKQHVEVISRFAQLENKYGSAERAQTLMEHVLTSYPKRVDVWCSYVDMLVKSSHLELARQVLERAVAQSLPARRMKVLFKKFLQFEEQHGTPEGADRVRQMAVEYVECGSAQTEN